MSIFVTSLLKDKLHHSSKLISICILQFQHIYLLNRIQDLLYLYYFSLYLYVNNIYLYSSHSAHKIQIRFLGWQPRLVSSIVRLTQFPYTCSWYFWMRHSLEKKYHGFSIRYQTIKKWNHGKKLDKIEGSSQLPKEYKLKTSCNLPQRSIFLATTSILGSVLHTKLLQNGYNM